PAAMGYDTALNGVDLLSSFAWGVNEIVPNDYSVGLALGYFGFGWEQLSFGPSRLNRYQFGVGVPIAPAWYLGARYGLIRSDALNIGDFDSADIGLQWRPSPYFSVGLEMNHLNRPQVGGLVTPIQYVAGLTVRPLSQVEISGDVDTAS